MLAVSASVYASTRERERQEGGTAHGVTVPLTDRVEASLRFSKSVRLPFVQTETAGYHSQMQSLTTKGKLIAWPPSDNPQKEKGQWEREADGGKGPLAFLLSTWHWQLTLTQCPRWAGDMAQEAETPQRQTAVCFYAVLCFLCGCSWVDFKCHSSVTHVDDFDPVSLQPHLFFVTSSCIKQEFIKKRKRVLSFLSV